MTREEELALENGIAVRGALMETAKRAFLLGRDPWPREPNQETCLEIGMAQYALSLMLDRIEYLLVHQHQEEQAQNQQSAARREAAA